MRCPGSTATSEPFPPASGRRGTARFAVCSVPLCRVRLALPCVSTLDRVFPVERRCPGACRGPRSSRAAASGARRSSGIETRSCAPSTTSRPRVPISSYREAARSRCPPAPTSGGPGRAFRRAPRGSGWLGQLPPLPARGQARAVQRQHAGRPPIRPPADRRPRPARACRRSGWRPPLTSTRLPPASALPLLQRHRPPLRAGRARRRIERGIGPQAADIERGARRQRDAGGLAGRGPDEDVLDHATVIDLPEHVAGLDAAALRGDAGLDIDLRRVAAPAPGRTPAPVRRRSFPWRPRSADPD